MTSVRLSLIAALALSACDGSAPEPVAAPETIKSAASASADSELALLKALTAPDACAWLSMDKLKQVYPDLSFAVHQAVAPRMSGYVWDSRCVYWAGVGSIEFAKDAPTHTVEIFIATAADESRARSNLASQRELATTSTGYQTQPALGADAYAIIQTGAASIYFVRGQSLVQINVSELRTPNDEKLRRANVLAQLL